jgi:tetratricopeptide (TPR) repeat protein
MDQISSQSEIEAYLEKAELLSGQFKFREGVACLKDCLHLFSDSIQVPQRIQIMSKLARISGIMEEYGAALAYVDEFEQLCRTTKDNENLHLALKIRGNCLLALEDFERALDVYRESWSIAIKCEREDWEGAVLNNIGIIFRNLEDLEEARRYYQLSVEKNLKANNPQYVRIARYNLAAVECDLNNHLHSEAEFKAILQESLADNDHFHVSLAYDGLGQVESFKGNPQKANEYFQKAIDLLEKLKQTRFVTEVRMDWARALHRAGKDPELTEKFYREAGWAPKN